MNQAHLLKTNNANACLLILLNGDAMRLQFKSPIYLFLNLNMLGQKPGHKGPMNQTKENSRGTQA